MSNIFAPYARYSDGLVPISLDPTPDHANMHLWFDSAAYLQASEDAPVDHWGAGLPYDAEGRLVVSTGPVSYVDQGIPFTSEGSVAIQEGLATHYDQGIGITATGHIATFLIGGGDAVPRWFAIADKSDLANELGPPADYDVSGRVISPSSPITAYAIVPPVPDFTIDVNGVIHVPPGQPVDVYTIAVTATNATGESDPESFQWTILQATPLEGGGQISTGEFKSGAIAASYTLSGGGQISTGEFLAGATLTPPDWVAKPADQVSNLGDGPQTFSMLTPVEYVTSDSGPLDTWEIDPPVAGFTIDSNGVIHVTPDAS